MPEKLAITISLFVASVVCFFVWYTNAALSMSGDSIRYTSFIYEFFGHVGIIFFVMAMFFMIIAILNPEKRKVKPAKREASPDEIEYIVKLNRKINIAPIVSFFAAILAIPCFFGALHALCSASYCPERAIAGPSAIFFFIFTATAIIAYIKATEALVQKCTIISENNLAVPKRLAKLSIWYIIMSVVIMISIYCFMLASVTNGILVFILQILT